MKRPYLSQHERQLILLGTLVGDHKNVRLKANLLARSIKRAFFKLTQRKVPLPDESEVIGKDLPVGFRFMKDGKVVEVVVSITCKGCVYAHFGTSNPILNTRTWSCEEHPKCYTLQRKYDNSVAFKYKQ